MKKYLLIFMTCFFTSFFASETSEPTEEENQISMHAGLNSDLNRYHSKSSNESRINKIENRLEDIQTKYDVNELCNLCPVNHGPYFETSFLYWKAQANGWVYGVDVQQATYSITTQVIDYKWDEGVRIILGYNTNYDNWDTSINYVYYYNKMQETRIYDSNDTNSGLFSVWAPNEIINLTDSNYQLDYHDIALELARSFYATELLSLRPHIDIHAVYIYQKFQTIYSGFSRDTVEEIRYSEADAKYSYDEETKDEYYARATIPSESIELIENLVKHNAHARSRFFGIGPKIGLDSMWQLGAGFSLFGNASGSLLYGNTKTKLQYLGQQNDEYKDFYSINKFKDLCPMLNILCGLSWGYCFNEQNILLSLNGGWETTYLWNAYQFCNTPSLTTGGEIPYKPLSLVGYTFSLKMEF